MKIDKDRLYYGDRVGTPEENLAYNQGLEDAWDLARLIIFRDEDARVAFHDNPPESIFESLTAQKALHTIKQANASRIEKRIKELFDEYGVETVLEVGKRLASDRN